MFVHVYVTQASLLTYCNGIVQLILVCYSINQFMLSLILNLVMVHIVSLYKMIYLIVENWLVPVTQLSLV